MDQSIANFLGSAHHSSGDESLDEEFAYQSEDTKGATNGKLKQVYASLHM